MKPHMTQYSQQSVLRNALTREGVTHDAKILATLQNVSLNQAGEIFFCRSELEINTVLQEGDGGALPNSVVMGDFQGLRCRGNFDIENVEVSVNGSIALVPTSATRVKVAAG